MVYPRWCNGVINQRQELLTWRYDVTSISGSRPGVGGATSLPCVVIVVFFPT